ncbi:MAG: COG1615 family transporter [Clostridia bacterium]|nr:COG1615 family transporter [Clostridia bacterium]
MKEKISKFISRRLVVILFFIIYAIIFLVSTRGEYLQYKEIGEQYVSIFFKNLRTKYIVFFVAFVISYFMIFISNKIVTKSLKEIFANEEKKMPHLPNKSISFIVSVVVAFIAGKLLTKQFLLFTNVAEFGIYDPIFKLDVSFYMFQIPFIKSILFFLIVYIAILTIYMCIYYIVTINVCLNGVDMEDLKKNRFLKHVFINIFIIASLIAGIMVVGSQEIVTGNLITLNDEAKTELIGAGLTEVKVKVIGYRILGVVILFSLFRTIKYLKKFKVKKIISSMLITPIYLVLLFGVMTGFQYIYANRNELDKQKKYIEENIKNTREAYNINIDEIEVDNTANLENPTIVKNSDVLSQITLIDPETTLANLSEYKDNEGYYTYQSTKIGRYDVNGKTKSLYVTPREIISGANRTYNNKTYQYTHGYGVVVSDANKADEKTGSISYVQSKYTSSEDKISIKEPRIYFGMATNDTVVTNVRDKKEFDYPNSTTSYEENEYKGEAGINANLLDRAVLALSEHDYKLLFNTSMTKDSKILMNRNIRERAKTLLPYVIYDESPYMVIRADGELVWVVDAYTVSNSYPFSQKTNINIEGKNQQINYIRNSIKVIIDAYDGTTTFYITDKTDPIAMLYYNIYPELFANKDEEIPEDIQKNIVYPEFLYSIQSKMLERYHNVSTEILYRSDDVWKIDSQISKNSNEENSTKPYYTYLKTKDSDAKLGLVVPYTKSNKQSLNSYLVGTYNGSNKLVLYKLISDTTLPGIQQLNVQIDQDKTISEELEKLNTSGTEIIRKTYIIPIENSILYVQPVYQILLNESKVPTLKKVIVASGTRVAIGDDLMDALKTLITDSAGKIQFINKEDEDQIIDAVLKAKKNVYDSWEAKDFSMFGSDMETLFEYIDQLEKVREKNKIDKKDM